MISTPVCDFVRDYAASAPVRLHMPGHKGRGILGCESLDITEIRGADDLYHPEGILARSEENASRLFGCRTVYSAEGSSLAIRAMLYLAYTRSGCKGRCLAGRNAHKSFLHTAVLLDFPISWLWAGDSYLSCPVTAETVEAAILEEKEKPFAVYLTSPDYLGNLAPVGEIASVCHRYGVPLLVDNAHGAYLKFLPRSLHPMDLGADLCCDSAHKTLPVLTGGAYLHMGPDWTAEEAKAAMALFGSTSPSWLILQSLDGANPLLEHLPGDIAALAPHIAALKGALLAHGFALVGAEPLKITVHAAKFGYSGEEMAEILEKQGIFCEFADRDFLVFMLTPRNNPEELDRLRSALCALPRGARQEMPPIALARPKAACTPRQAAFAPRETIPVENSLGRILALANVSCPPAVPIVMCGEEIDEAAQEALRRCGIEEVTVIKASPSGVAAMQQKVGLARRSRT